MTGINYLKLLIFDLCMSKLNKSCNFKESLLVVIVNNSCLWLPVYGFTLHCPPINDFCKWANHPFFLDYLLIFITFVTILIIALIFSNFFDIFIFFLHLVWTKSLEPLMGAWQPHSDDKIAQMFLSLSNSQQRIKRNSLTCWKMSSLSCKELNEKSDATLIHCICSWSLQFSLA